MRDIEIYAITSNFEGLCVIEQVYIPWHPAIMGNQREKKIQTLNPKACHLVEAQGC